MTPREILAKADYDGITPQELDKESEKSGLEESLRSGYDPNKLDTSKDETFMYKGVPQHVTLIYTKEHERPLIGDGNHRVRILSKIAPDTPIPVLHFRRSTTPAGPPRLAVTGIEGY